MLEESLTIDIDEDSQVTAIISHVVRPGHGLCHHRYPVAPERDGPLN